MPAADDLRELAAACDEINEHGFKALSARDFTTTKRGRLVMETLERLACELITERFLRIEDARRARAIESGLRDDIQRLTDELEMIGR